MMRSTLLSLGVLLAMHVACVEPNPSFDPGVVDPGADNSASPAPPQHEPGLQPQPTAPQDPTPQQPSPGDTRPPSAFGALCDASGCAGGLQCLHMNPESELGICLPECTTPNEMCTVPDPRLTSGCARYFNSDTEALWVCVIFCQLGKKHFPCPNEQDYGCRVVDGFGICVPR